MVCLHSSRLLLATLCLLGVAQSSSGPWPGTSRTVHFEITLTWENIHVAGASRKMILTNGQFPGPTLQLKQGEDVEFLVRNHLPFATTIHFHGIEQQGTPWSDGVPGISQWPIEPGRCFLYRWKATQYGSYVYHAHTNAHIEDGLYGAIYIKPNQSQARPFKLISEDPGELERMLEAEKYTQPLILSDWRHLSSSEVWETERRTGIDAFCANAILFNGKGSVTCLSQAFLNQSMTAEQRGALMDKYAMTDMGCLPPVDNLEGYYNVNMSAVPAGFLGGCNGSGGAMETLSVDPTRKYVSYDIVSMASATLMMVSIDRHTMYVYAIDGRYIEPMRVNVITVPIGSRYSVLLPLDQPAGTYNIRAVNSGINQILNGTAVLTYNTSHQSQQEAVSKPWIDIVGRDTSQSTVFFDEAKVIPFPIETPPVEVNNTYHLTISHVNSSYRWKMGNSSLMPSYQEDTPVLFNRSSISSDARISTTSGTWVDLIISVSGVAEPSHPIHKHSNKFYVIGQGYGPFEYSSVTEAMKASPQYFNFQTPQIRDTFGTLASPQGQSWLAIRYHVRNPGPFLLHCHAPEHEVGGMAVVVLDGIDAWPSLPAEYRVPNGSSVGVVGLKQERPK